MSQEASGGDREPGADTARVDRDRLGASAVERARAFLPPGPRRSAAVAVGLYLASVVVAWGLGYRMEIPWQAQQLLDGEALSERPMVSILLMHSQPPLLNVLLAVTLGVASGLGVTAQSVAAAGGLVAGAVFVIVLQHLVTSTTASPRLGLLAVVATVTNPGFHLYGNLFFYTFPVALLLLVLLALAHRFVRDGDGRTLFAIAAVVASVTLFRTAYPWIWALAALSLIVAGRYWVAREVSWSRAAAAAVLVVVAVNAWPLKNHVVFGEYVTSSWQGYNLAQNTGAKSRKLDHARLQDGIARMNARFGEEAARVVSARARSDGRRNWNYYGLLVTYEQLATDAMAWRMEHKGEWLLGALEQYPMWARATFTRARFGDPNAPPGALPYAELYRKVFFFDLRGMVDGLLPSGALDGFAVVRGRKIRFTVFAVMVFPVTMLLASVLLVRRLPARRPADVTVAIAMFCVLWSLLIPCLTDGTEGNRLRFTTAALFHVVLLYVVSRVAARGPGTTTNARSTARPVSTGVSGSRGAS